MIARSLPIILVTGCSGGPALDPMDPCTIPYDDPADWPSPNQGPGVGAVSFAADALQQNCAYLDGGESDLFDHHNLVSMYDGYLLMPWAPEWGQGGLTLWDLSDPCNPQWVGGGTSPQMRETHAIGYAFNGGQWAVTNAIDGFVDGGVLFWDLSDSLAPTVVSMLDVEGFAYPDAYARVTLSVFWQAPYVFAGGADNGVYVIDASDPAAPEVVHQIGFEPILRVGQVQVVGNLLIASEAEGPRTVLLDVSDPTDPEPIGGGDFLSLDGEGLPREAYFSNIGGGYVYYARKDGGGGLMIHDIHDPGAPAFVGDVTSTGNGGYVFVKEGLAYVGEGSFAAVYDVSDPASPTSITEDLLLQGDLDTATPVGHLVVLSVDDGANPDEGSAIVPMFSDPDVLGPEVTWAWPADGATDLPLGSRFGVTLSEMVDPKSAHAGAVRLQRSDGTGLAGHISVQENVVNFVPRCALDPDATYTLSVMADGITDFSGNPAPRTFEASFTTGSSR